MEGKHLQDNMERLVGLLRSVLPAHHFTQICTRRRRKKVSLCIELQIFHLSVRIHAQGQR
jgi:hypothetical protein